jgi:hypothetical protein
MSFPAKTKQKASGQSNPIGRPTRTEERITVTKQKPPARNEECDFCFLN